MHSISVGRPYIEGRSSWPEASEYNYAANGHELRLFWPSPSDAETAAVRGGRMDLAILVRQPVILLLYRITGACGWSDAPYSWHLVPESHRDLPDEPKPDERALLQIVLIDASTGIVRAIRATTLTPHATNALHRAIRAQSAAPWDAGDYDAALQQLQQRSCDDLAAAAQVTMRAGGA